MDETLNVHKLVHDGETLWLILVMEDLTNDKLEPQELDATKIILECVLGKVIVTSNQVQTRSHLINIQERSKPVLLGWRLSSRERKHVN